jgi:uncharacterized protein YndB with AHSA1/START domain
MIDPLRLAFEVDAPQEHAFDTYTRGLGRWWPADHTHTGRADLRIEMEARVGGRIFERTPEGDEFDWGRVVVWEPPGRLVYSWHLRRDPHEATEVEILFRSIGEDATRVEIEHRGWERLGAEGQTWRDRNAGGWTTLLPHFEAALATTARATEETG